MTATARTSIPHLPALDGLRGVAVVGVLLFHCNWLRGGYLGVDLFFVLSGFLITSLLLAEWRAKQRIDLSEFWIRRARRLLPALLAVLPAVSLYALFFAETTELSRIRGDGLATLLYVANWRSIFRGSDYWALFAAPSPLEHTWSLAIEEQFYVLWPLAVAATLKLFRGSVRAVCIMSVTLALCSMLAMALIYSPERVSRVYMGTDTRGASILLGAAFACLMARQPALSSRWQLSVLDLVGGVACAWLGYAWCCMDGQSSFLYRGGFWLSELAVLVVLACAREGQRSLWGRLLMLRPLTDIGLISYGLYLWHWPVFVVLTEARTHVSGVRLGLLRLGVSLAVALVSYHLLELPIRRSALRRFSPGIVLPGSVFASVAAILFATRGATALPTSVLAVAPGALPNSETAPEGSLRVLVVGDSVALSLGERMSAVAHRHQASVATRAVGNCSLFEQVVPALSLEQRAHDGGNCSVGWEQDVRSVKPDVVLVVLGGGYFARAKVEGRWQSACDPGWNRVYRQQLRTQLEALARHTAHVVVARVPYPAGTWRRGNWDEKVNCFNAILETEAAKVPGAKVLDLHDYLCRGGACKLESQGAAIRPDGVHFVGLGAEESAAWVIENIRFPTST
jgi:peptidoglycan/LPS O-acetylase OafA/YrhL